jgi:hypothetical protein
MCIALLVGWLLSVPVPDQTGFSVKIVDALGSPRRLAAADLDGDHRVDLFVMQAGPAGSPRLQVFLNHGGNFSPGWTQSWSSDGSAVTIFDADLADTDNDGDNDVVYCVSVSAPGQRFNDGHGNFDATGLVPTFSVRFENELVDIDDNGNIDLVYYEPDFFFDTYFGTQVGNGNGTFAWAFYTEHMLSADLESHRRIAIGDITGDGLRDAVFTSVITGGIRFFEGRPAPPGKPIPTWKSPQLVYAPACNDAAIADLDSDGHLDLIATAKSLDSVVVFLTQPIGAIGLPRLYAAGQTPDALAAADFDLDGYPDVIVANPATGTVHVFRGTGTGGLGPPRVVPVGQSPSDVATADLDNDGDIDVAIACADHVALLINNALSPTVHFTQK